VQIVEDARVYSTCCADAASDSAAELTSPESQRESAGMWDYLDSYIVNPDATILTLQCWAPD